MSLLDLLKPLQQQQLVVLQLQQQVSDLQQNGTTHSSDGLAQQLDKASLDDLTSSNILPTDTSYLHAIQQYDVAVFTAVSQCQHQVRSEQWRLSDAKLPYISLYNQTALSLLQSTLPAMLADTHVSPHYRASTIDYICCCLTSTYTHIQQYACGSTKSDVTQYCIVLSDIMHCIDSVQQLLQQCKKSAALKAEQEALTEFYSALLALHATVFARCCNVISLWLSDEWQPMLTKSTYKYIQTDMPTKIAAEWWQGDKPKQAASHQQQQNSPLFNVCYAYLLPLHKAITTHQLHTTLVTHLLPSLTSTIVQSYTEAVPRYAKQVNAYAALQWHYELQSLLDWLYTISPAHLAPTWQQLRADWMQKLRTSHDKGSSEGLLQQYTVDVVQRFRHSYMCCYILLYPSHFHLSDDGLSCCMQLQSDNNRIAPAPMQGHHSTAVPYIKHHVEDWPKWRDISSSKHRPSDKHLPQNVID